MSSQERLIGRYLWAVGGTAAQVRVGKLVASRYRVEAPQIWLDTLPESKPDLPGSLNSLGEIIPYLRLFPHRRHVPEVYGYARLENRREVTDILLLENVPVTASGGLYPGIAEAWSGATTVLQVYWLWQMTQLWNPLSAEGVASSLLVPENIRVQGGRVWLLELLADRVSGSQEMPKIPSLEDFASCWWSWITQSNSAVSKELQDICQQMYAADATTKAIAPALNQLLLEVAAQQPLQLEFAGGSEKGPRRFHNEDSCFPQTVFPPDSTVPDDDIIPGLAIVCDGVGGHDRGEVASQMAVRALCLQVQGLLQELAQQTELVMPYVCMEHLSSAIRVVNNLIAAQNDEQGRESRQRMATTLVMALQIPQKVSTADGSHLGNSHELYLAHVGDSRAYWITRDYCQLLTVDDDVSVREVSEGRATYWQALREPDGGSLTQALGTRDGESIEPNVQRLILAEDGVLLLCSDGLSDRDCIEQSWTDCVGMMFDENRYLDEAVQAWINLANRKNGHDNTSVVLVRCRVSDDLSQQSVTTGTVNAGLTSDRDPDFSPQQAAIANPESLALGRTSRQGMKKRVMVVCALLAIFLIVTAVGLLSWSQMDPKGFKRLRESLQLPGDNSSSNLLQ
ncbi:MAG: protein phosphatase 2C domain-containing protein [Hormoscilla sp. SP5CHS1]|nr:protein phosphatase 2C domain-containing protein [Hormoscilla sp. SP12CHS1]MBC6453110.1 protein phosphatase 2C domain-containing protein [Hormoscilla sp. SP5CHS1]